MTRKAQRIAPKAASKERDSDVVPTVAKKKPLRPARHDGARTGREPGSAPTSKSAAVLAALQRDRGATLEDLMAVTGWQAHSIRGFLSGTVRKKLALNLVTDGKGSNRTYRITGAVAGAKAA